MCRSCWTEVVAYSLLAMRPSEDGVRRAARPEQPIHDSTHITGVRVVTTDTTLHIS
jgi:hypothetical protein